MLHHVCTKIEIVYTSYCDSYIFPISFIIVV